MVIEKREKVAKSLQAVHCELDGVKFDSLGERAFYIRLVRIFGSVNVHRSGRIEIVAKCANSPGMYWDADFEVFHEGKNKIFEYKGSLKKNIKGNREFFHKWSMIHSKFSSLNPAKFHTFVQELYYPVWQTELGKVTVPGIHAVGLMTDSDIKALFD